MTFDSAGRLLVTEASGGESSYTVKADATVAGLGIVDGTGAQGLAAS